jgi:hypothetical protein
MQGICTCIPETNHFCKNTVLELFCSYYSLCM